MPAISGWKKLMGICMKDKITLSWISRNRSTLLAISIFSFLNRLSHHLNLEIIISLDDDDEKSMIEVLKITEVIDMRAVKSVNYIDAKNIADKIIKMFFDGDF